MTLNWITVLFGIFYFATISYALPIQDDDLLAELDSNATVEDDNALPSAISDIHSFTIPKETGCKFKSPEEEITPGVNKRSSCNGSKRNVCSETLQCIKELTDVVTTSLKRNGVKQINIELLFHEEHGNKEPPVDPETTTTTNEITKPSIETPTDICEDPSLDTIVQTQDGNRYLFKGDLYWRTINNVIADGYPRIISYDWGGLEGNLDASFTWFDDTYFFKGKYCWRFYNRKADCGYPKLISERFKGIPNNLDAAFFWRSINRIYFFKGNEFWCYDSDKNPPVKDCSMEPISKFKGLPVNSVDAAYATENDTYFFKGRHYYKYDLKSRKVSHSNPGLTAQWFTCPSK